MFFATIDELIARMEISEETKVVVLRMRRVSTIDITAVRALENLLDMCKSRGITLIFSHTMYQPYTVMERAGFVDKVGKENFCINIGVSLDRAEKLME